MSNGLPDLNHPVSGPFWRAASEHRLELSFCRQCGGCVWYSQSPTPCCQAKLDWREMGKRARLVTWTEVQMPINPNFEAPYTVALVTPEGAGNARVVSRLIDVAGDQLRCDMPLRLDFVELSNQQKETFIAPVYRPA